MDKEAVKHKNITELEAIVDDIKKLALELKQKLEQINERRVKTPNTKNY